MKNTLFLFIPIILLTACNLENKVENTPKIPATYISGQLENPLSETLYISGGDILEKIKVNEDGTFSDTLQLHTGYYGLRHKKSVFNVYLEQGKHLKITADMETYPESLSFAGNGVENNNYINKKGTKTKDIIPHPSKLYVLEEVDFLAKEDEIHRKAKSELELVALSPEFTETEQQNIDYQHLERLKNYPSYHAYFAKKEGFKPESEAFAKPFEGFDFDNEAHYQMFPSYNGMVNTYYMDIFDREKMSTFIEVLQEVKSESIKNDLLSKLSYYVSPGNEKSEGIYQLVMLMSSDEELKERVSKKYELVKSMDKGKPSPKFI